MRLSAVFCTVSGLLAFSSSVAFAADDADCTLQRYTTVDITIDDKGTVSVPVMIGDVPASAELGLGSVFNTVFLDAARRLQLSARPLRVREQLNTQGGNITQYARAVTVTIGRLRIAGDFLLLPAGDADNPAEGEPALGMSLFSGVDFELDFAQRKMHFYSQDHCEENVVYWADTYGKVPIRHGQYREPFLVMELEGQKIETGFGTNYETTRLADFVAEDLFGIELDSTTEKEDSDDSAAADASSEQYQFMSLTTDGIEVMGLNVSLAEGSEDCGLRRTKGVDRAAGFQRCGNNFPLMLGMDILRQMRLYFANKEEMLYFTAADARK